MGRARAGLECLTLGTRAGMSLWVDKYRPCSLGQLDYHKEQAAQLRNLVSRRDGAARAGGGEERHSGVSRPSRAELCSGFRCQVLWRTVKQGRGQTVGPGAVLANKESLPEDCPL